MHRRKRRSPWLPILLLLVAAAGAAWFMLQRSPAPESPSPAQGPVPVALPPPMEAQGPRHPVEAIEVPEEAMGELPLATPEDADAQLLRALTELLEDEALAALFIPEFLVQRIVVSIDNLTQPRVASRILPVRPMPGSFGVEGIEGDLRISSANAGRYDAVVAGLDSVDIDRLVALYVRMYPRLQAAYRELGDPEAHFNDRLVEVLDHALRAPEPPLPIALVRTERGLEFADPALESLSVAHKAMLRMGPAHAGTVKARLRLLRARIAATPPGA